MGRESGMGRENQKKKGLQSLKRAGAIALGMGAAVGGIEDYAARPGHHVPTFTETERDAMEAGIEESGEAFFGNKVKADQIHREKHVPLVEKGIKERKVIEEARKRVMDKLGAVEKVKQRLGEDIDFLAGYQERYENVNPETGEDLTYKPKKGKTE